MSARDDRDAFLAELDARLIKLGGHVVRLVSWQLERATLGQCEAVDVVHMPGFYTIGFTASTRCTNTGVRIRETDTLGHARHRTVCPKHGFDPAHTPPLTPEEL